MLKNRKGFSLIELFVVVAMVSIMVAMSILLYDTYTVRAKIASAVQDLKSLEVAFFAYLIENETFPDDTHIVLPAGMDEFVSGNLWGATPLGGTYNWDGPNFYPYAGISFFEPTASASTFLALDRMIDDGVLVTGKFRVSSSNGRYSYIIDE